MTQHDVHATRRPVSWPDRRRRTIRHSHSSPGFDPSSSTEGQSFIALHQASSASPRMRRTKDFQNVPLAFLPPSRYDIRRPPPPICLSFPPSPTILPSVAGTPCGRRRGLVDADIRLLGDTRFFRVPLTTTTLCLPLLFPWRFALLAAMRVSL